MRNADPKAGFTLIEMMAVMMIIALVSSLAMSMPFGTSRAGLKATVFETAALFRRERMSALLSGRERGVTLDRSARAFIGRAGGMVALPNDVALDILNAETSTGELVRFLPDGASTGAVIRFTRDNGSYVLRVNWLTGGVMIDAS